MAKIVKLYSDKERFEIISEFIQSGESMDAFQKKNGMGHCTLSEWMTKFGISYKPKNRILAMKELSDQDKESTIREDLLKSRISELEKELEYEKLKSLAYSTMIDVAEEKFGIKILKKALTHRKCFSFSSEAEN